MEKQKGMPLPSCWTNIVIGISEFHPIELYFYIYLREPM